MAQEKDLLRLLFVGDFYSNDIEKVSFSSELEREINASNIVFCNFEAPIKIDNIATQKVGPSLAQSVKAPDFLEKKGFNVIGLANNHVADFGQEGILRTMESFQHSLLLGVGTFEQAYSLKKVKIGENTIGFLAFCHYEFGILDNRDDNKTLGSAWINHPCVDSLIEESKKTVDLLILVAHAGVEDIDLPLPEWRERYKSFIHLGVDAVIGMHPHVPQGWELINGKPIFYSLGNFYFDMHSDIPMWNRGLGVVLEYKNNTIVNISILNLLNDDGVIRVDKCPEINEYVKSLSERISNGAYMSSLNNLVLDLWDNVYEKYLFIGTNGLTLKYGLNFFLKRLYGALFRKKGMPLFLLNIFRCESHRWLIQRALDLKSKMR